MTQWISNQAEIYVINPDGTGRLQLTFNDLTKSARRRGPRTAPRSCSRARIGGGEADFEICVMNADGSGFQQLTNNTVPHPHCLVVARRHSDCFSTAPPPAWRPRCSR